MTATVMASAGHLPARSLIRGEVLVISSSARWRLSVVAIAAGVALASCSSSPSSSSASAGGGGGNGGGKASSVKACDLLTLDEIKQATGATMGAGVLQTTDTQANCEWSAPSDVSSGATGLGVKVQDYDDTLWQTFSAAKQATAVSGIGEKAYKDYPAHGDLSVKQGGYEIDIGIADFTDDNATVDAAALALMKLVLPRL